jgi:hypothetical protein
MIDTTPHPGHFYFKAVRDAARALGITVSGVYRLRAIALPGPCKNRTPVL